MQLINCPVAMPAGVHAVMTTRQGGHSSAPFDSLNLGVHVGDDPAMVAENRRAVVSSCHLPAEPHWLSQVHGKRVALSGDADASYSRELNSVLAIQVADCVPVLIWSTDGQEIAAVHAGWQGLYCGVIGAAVGHFESDQLNAWIAPHVRQCHYEVDRPLWDKFGDDYPTSFVAASSEDRWRLSLSTIARHQLLKAGVGEVCESDLCTVCEEALFFSYRRDGRCGRMAAFIWREKKS